jgi:hypothetical protein
MTDITADFEEIEAFANGGKTEPKKWTSTGTMTARQQPGEVLIEGLQAIHQALRDLAHHAGAVRHRHRVADIISLR